MSGIDRIARVQAANVQPSRASGSRVDATPARFMRVWAEMQAQTRASVAHVLRELAQVPREVPQGPSRERP